MSTNPYAVFLNGQDAASLVNQLPDKLTAVISELGATGMGLSLAPGKWTVREILCHLADTEIAFAFRWRQALAEEDPVVQPFDQDLWARHYATMSGEQALQAFVALRRWNLILLDQLGPADWDRRVTHPE